MSSAARSIPTEAHAATEELEPDGVLRAQRAPRQPRLRAPRARPLPGDRGRRGHAARRAAPSRDPRRAGLLGRPSPRGPERLAPPRGHRGRRRRRADPRRPQRQRHLRQRRPRDRRATARPRRDPARVASHWSFASSPAERQYASAERRTNHDVWSPPHREQSVTPDPGEAGTMRRRWWLVAVVFVISMGMTGLPAGAQLPAPTPTVPTPTVPHATGPGADRSDAHSPGAHRPDSDGADAPARPEAPGASTCARPFRAGPCPVGHRAIASRRRPSARLRERSRRPRRRRSAHPR